MGETITKPQVHLKNYQPHDAQKMFHYAVDNLYQFTLMVAGIRGGKTYAGARQAVKEAWNAKGKGNFLIVAPTYNMLDRTTWQEFKDAAAPFIASENETKKIITLKNGRKVHGHSAENPDRIRNETAIGAWADECREFKDFEKVWKVLLGRVLSTNGKIFGTTSPNSYDDIHERFIANRKPGYGVVKFSTYFNTFLDKDAIDRLGDDYDAKTKQQELLGEFVIFEGAVYYTFSRTENAGKMALEVAQYDPRLPIGLCCDFNVDPMAWPMTQIRVRKDGLKQVVVFDEIFLRNSNTEQACREFKARLPNHKAGIVLYGDATGTARHADSNVTNWKIIQNELNRYPNVTMRVPSKNPAERDRINSLNGLICNSKNDRRLLVNPKCKHLIGDLEQVSFKEGSTQIDKTKNILLTHPSDALGYLADREFSLNKSRFEVLKY